MRLGEGDKKWIQNFCLEKYGKHSLRIPRRRWEDNIKVCLTEVGYKDVG